MHCYTLEGTKPVKCDNMMEWGAWMETADRQIARSGTNSGLIVSTVFLGLDYNFGEGKPVLFETMTFGGDYDQYMERYRTYADALVGHDLACKRAKVKNDNLRRVV